MSIQAYQRAAAQAESPRETEYRAFGLVTQGLVRAREQGRGDLSAYVEALDANRRLWMVLANDCAQSGNAAPETLRASIISLSLWVSRTTSEIIRDGGDLDDLIEVNRSIMEGLAGRT
ncbi:MAG: flagellar biosynthesis regulator FlaF [Alphaproteobacteria bacterium]|nr:flagellar biosynthesis regulator FlaF [Alphaproteobacteria bacterium]